MLWVYSIAAMATSVDAIIKQQELVVLSCSTQTNFVWQMQIISSTDFTVSL